MTDSPRAVAATFIGRVLRTGAYSNVLLAQIEDTPDGRLTRRLVYGTLRYLLRIDRLLAGASNRPLGDVEPGLLDTLRVATWELRFGDGAPHAAVNEAVNVAQRRIGKPAGGFANAVLRAVQSSDEDLPADAPGTALRLGVAPWILERLTAAWGAGDAVEFLTRSLEPAARAGRVRPGASATGGTAVAGIGDAVVGASPQEGIIAMDPASVAVGSAADISPGMTVLDLAAAPGGKTLHLYDQLAGRGTLIAADLHPRRATSALAITGEGG